MSFIALLLVVILLFITSRLSNRLSKIESKLSGMVKVEPGVASQTQATSSNSAFTPFRAGNVAVPTSPTVAQPSSSVPAESHDSKAGLWFGGIGAVSLILAVGFFLRYVFINNLISEPLRVLLGILAGAGFVALGVYIHRKYPKYGGLVAGVGFALEFLSFYAQYAQYHLISYGWALTSLFVVGVLGLFLARYLKSNGFSVWCLVGAYITPVLFGFENFQNILPGSSADMFTGYFFFYITALGAVALVMSNWMRAQAIPFVSLIGFGTGFLAWHSTNSPMQDSVYNFALLVLTVNALIFFAQSIVSMRKSDRYSSVSGAFSITSAGVMYCLMYVLITLNDNSLIGLGEIHKVGLMTFIWAAVYGVAWVFTYALNIDMDRFRALRYVLGSISLCFLAIFVGVQFERESIVLGWAVMAFALCLAAIKLRSSVAWYYANILIGLSAVKVLSLTVGGEFVFGGKNNFEPFINTTFITSVLVIIVSALMGTFYKINKDNKLKTTDLESGQGGEQGVGREIDPSLATNYCFGVSYALALIIPTLEIQRSDAASYWQAVYVLALALVVFFSRNISVLGWRAVGYITAGIGLISMTLTLPGHTNFIWNPFFGLIIYSTIVVWVIGYRLLRFGQNYPNNPDAGALSKFAFIIGGIILLSGLTSETTTLIDTITKSNSWNRTTAESVKSISVSILWLIYALIVMVIGIVKRYVSARWFATTLIAIVIVKVFIFDSSGLTDIYRFFAYGALGVILIFIGYLYTHFKDRIQEFLTGK